MKTLIVAAALAASLALSGCAGVGAFLASPAKKDTMGEAILQHIEGCARHYTGALGAGVTGSFEITCEPQPGAGLRVGDTIAAPLPPT